MWLGAIKCEKYAEYALKYAKYVKSMGKCELQQVCAKICKICKMCDQKYDMQNMHSHFADVHSHSDSECQWLLLGVASRQIRNEIPSHVDLELELERLIRRAATKLEPL